ncbi:MAG: hypothetical protein HW415_751 [Deltaproteobacteria bacterium]|nr:hypothetical protein [Deltaproteobacteria bacterium]
MTTIVRFTFILLYLCVALFDATNVSANDILDLSIENELLESELALSQKAKVYFIFNLKDKKVSMRTRGATLKELPIVKVKAWNLRIPVKPQALLKRSTLFEPRREDIKPQEKETGSSDKFEIDALELDDMPSRFNLILADGVVITVRPTPRGVLSYLENMGYSLFWHISRPLLTAWDFLGKKPYSSIYISMEKMDAQSLYWSFYEGSQCIIYNP